MSTQVTDIAHWKQLEEPIDIRRPSPADGLDPVPRISPKTALRLGRQQATRDVLTALPLLALDFLAAYLAAMTATLMGQLVGTPVHPWFWIGVVLLTVTFQYLNGLYPAVGVNYQAEFHLLLRTTIVVSLGSAFALAARTDMISFQWASWLSMSCVLFLCLSSFRPIARHKLKRFAWWTQPVAVIGHGEHALRLLRRISGLGHEGFRPCGLISDVDPQWSDGTSMTALASSEHNTWLGPPTDLESILDDNNITRIAVSDRQTVSWRDFHCFHGIPHVMLPADLGQQPIERMRIRENSGEVAICCDTSLVKPMALAIKRAVDVTLIVVTSPFWVPLMVLIALSIKLLDPGPVFYRQSRVGRYGQKFRALKFRSMVIDADRKLKEYLDKRPDLRAEWETTHKLRDDPRVTKIGEFLRKTSLDELPQLFNVLRGEMSLVGPRPIVNCGSYDRKYIQEYPDVFELYKMVRPGITGLWQVNGRNHTTYKERVFYDRFYLHNWSLSLDLYILWRTIKTALFREGAC